MIKFLRELYISNQKLNVYKSIFYKIIIFVSI